MGEGIGGGHVDPQGAQVGWPFERGHVLHDAAMGGADHADVPVAPGLTCGPFNGVVAVLALKRVGGVEILAGAL